MNVQKKIGASDTCIQYRAALTQIGLISQQGDSRLLSYRVETYISDG